ncbi:porin [Paraburkholderia sediminicola]|uniref:porin n=1 Tax=Paraburkholderia sediminicola TaxID=458836 RepID=UPI0038BB68DE
MKKSWFAAACVIPFASAAHAQSSVTLYGLIDVGLVYANNAGGAKQYAMAVGALNGNRWGLTGAEDLGGGYKAIFKLENGFSVATGALGQGGAEFGRQAFVGLSGPFGTVTLGRQYDSVVDYVGVLKAGGDTAGGYANHPADLDNTGNNYRVNNALKYASPDYKGFRFGGVFSPGGVAGNFQQNRVYSLGAGYKQGPLALGVAYLNARNPNFSYYGNNPASSTTASNMSSIPVYSGYASAQTLQTIAASAAYTIGTATAGVVYSNVQFRNLGATASLNPGGYSGNAVFNTVELNFHVWAAPDFLIGTSYAYTRGAQVSGGAAGGVTYNQLNLGVDYLLSKRTDIYAVVFGQHASGKDSTGKDARAAIYGLTASSTGTQIAATVGLRHKF